MFVIVHKKNLMEWCPIATIVFKSDEITAVPVYAVKTIF
jgi:hypothetical protein